METNENNIVCNLGIFNNDDNYYWVINEFEIWNSNVFAVVVALIVFVVLFLQHRFNANFFFVHKKKKTNGFFCFL